LETASVSSSSADRELVLKKRFCKGAVSAVILNADPAHSGQTVNIHVRVQNFAYASGIPLSQNVHDHDGIAEPLASFAMEAMTAQCRDVSEELAVFPVALPVLVDWSATRQAALV
jgi:hypothetical protein